jgi:signal transduction histidine kinase
MASVHPADRRRWRKHFAGARARGARFAVEYRLRGRDGRYRWMFDQALPRLGNDGVLAGYVGSSVDIHDRVVADQRHRRLANLYAALSNANEAIVRATHAQDLYQRTCDIVARYAAFRVAWIAMLEDDRRSMTVVAAHGDAVAVGERMAVRPDGGADLVDSPALAAIEEGRYCVRNDGWDEDGTATLPDAGAPSPRSIAAFPLFRHGNVAGVFVVEVGLADYFDAQMTQLLVALAANLSFALDSFIVESERNAAETALRQLNVTLEEKVGQRTAALAAANSELEAFSYSVSHDLRAPLRSIAGFADLLQERTGHELDAEALDYLQRVKKAAARMGALIDDLLNLSRVSRRDLSRRRVDLSRLAEAAIGDLRDAEPDRVVATTVAPDLAADADAGLMQILFANLIGNAWKFSRDAGQARIEVGCERVDGQAVFFVRDNGVGFPMEHADRIFAPFARLHTEREFKGTGIGLAIVARIVRRHGGRIWAEAEEGKGATFRFTLQD